LHHSESAKSYQPFTSVHYDDDDDMILW